MSYFNPQRGRNRSHATWLWYTVAAFLLLAICGGITAALSGCTSGKPTTARGCCPPPQTAAQTAQQPAPPPANAATRELCDAVVQNYYADRLPLVDTRAALTQAAKAPGVDGAVRRAVLDKLYAGGELPTKDNVTPRYDLVLDACRTAGWEG